MAWENGSQRVVVGDGGFAARTDNYNRPWKTVDLQTSADLHALITVGEVVIIVGDEAVRVLQDGLLLAADGEVPTSSKASNTSIGSRARELTRSSSNGQDPIGTDLIAVGDAGLAVSNTLVCE